MTTCPFCELAARAGDPLLAYRSESVYVVPALRQRARNRGHALVLPVRHAVGLGEAAAEVDEPTRVAQARALARALGRG
jgi:histidine triad (HIT) family protein